MQWVKASERLPNIAGSYYVKEISSGIRSLRYFRKKTKSLLSVYPKNYEWLDESPDRIFFTPEISELLTRLNEKDITITGFVEILNEKITGLTHTQQLKLNYGDK